MLCELLGHLLFGWDSWVDEGTGGVDVCASELLCNRENGNWRGFYEVQLALSLFCSLYLPNSW